jgi:hypothetical protein
MSGDEIVQRLIMCVIQSRCLFHFDEFVCAGGGGCE